MGTEAAMIIGAIAGGLLSVLANLVPGFNAWYEKQVKERKQQIMVGALAFGAAGWYGVSCLNPPFSVGLACDTAGLWYVGLAFFFAVLGNFGIYGGTKYLFGKGETPLVIIEGEPDDTTRAIVRDELVRAMNEVGR